MENSNTNALVKVRLVFTTHGKPMTLSEIREKTGLSSSSISMALCHLKKQRYVSRTLIANTTSRARKTVWCYEYHADKIAEPND